MFNEEELLIVKEKSLEDHIPIIMDDTLEVIKDILIKENPKRILEIGTAIGYSAIMMASCSPDITVTTIERDEKRYLEALKNIKKAPS